MCHLIDETRAQTRIAIAWSDDVGNGRDAWGCELWERWRGGCDVVEVCIVVVRGELVGLAW